MDKLKSVKLWITAGPRERFTASEVMYGRKDVICRLISKQSKILQGLGPPRIFKLLSFVQSQTHFHISYFLLFQMEALKVYLDGGGNILVMLGEGGEMKYDTNINFLLEDFGVMVNNGAY